MKQSGPTLFSNTAITEMCIPDSVEIIDNEAFYGCGSLTEITLPKGLKMMGGYAFCGCKNLKEIDLPDGLIFIGAGAFSSCGIESVNIPKGIKNIEYRCFADSKLKKIEIPGSVKSIGYGALSRIHSLKELILYEGIEEIGEETFAYSILENDGKGLLIPKSVVKIHECAFKITRLHRQVAKLLVYEGSYAHQYVQKIGLEYEIVKE